MAKDLTGGSIADDLDVLILAPYGRDASAAAEVLNRSRINAIPFKFLSEFCDRLSLSAGVILIAEEVLTLEAAEKLKTILSQQEPWSNVPIILMTSQVERAISTEKILGILGMGGSISLLERPFRILTLVASVKVALQARKRQYQVREFLKEQKLAVQQRDDFMSIASHELKTPITSIKLHVQMRKRQLSRGDSSVLAQDKVVSLLNMTESQIDRLSRLVDDMLDVSRIVNGKLSLHCELVNLGNLAQEVVANFSNQAQAAGCELKITVDHEVIGSWDSYRIEQVITNLITNAIKYGAGKPILVHVKKQFGKGVLSVSDQGMGIAPENQERIFERFERAIGKTHISGLGLGLYISHQIIDLHLGLIHVKSVPLQGSTFTIELPTI